MKWTESEENLNRFFDHASNVQPTIKFTHETSRNNINKLEKKSVQKYFYERCAGGPKSSDFWPTIKPFLSSKGVKTNNSITLSENNDIVNDPKKVSEIFNDFFIKVAKNIGNPNTVIDENHPSIQAF